MRFTFRFRVGQGFDPAAGLPPGAEFHVCVRSTKPSSLKTHGEVMCFHCYPRQPAGQQTPLKNRPEVTGKLRAGRKPGGRRSPLPHNEIAGGSNGFSWLLVFFSRPNRVFRGAF